MKTCRKRARLTFSWHPIVLLKASAKKKSIESERKGWLFSSYTPPAHYRKLKGNRAKTAFRPFIRPAQTRLPRLALYDELADINFFPRAFSARGRENRTHPTTLPLKKEVRAPATSSGD